MHNEEEMAYAYKAEHGEFPKYPASDNKPVTYPEGFKVLSAKEATGTKSSSYKRVHLEDERGHQVTALAFEDYCDYDQLTEGNYVDGYIRTKEERNTLVDYCKPDEKCNEGESFTSPNGTKYHNQ